MCIIIVAKKGLKVPMEHFKNSWVSNSDGAGLCYNENGVVRIRKGFMTFEQFQEALSEVPLSSDRVFHFRIATSGKVAPGTCHPYPVEQNYKAMYATDMLTSMACAHNGIIHWCTPKNGLKETFSDTMAFIAGYVHPLKDKVMNNTALQEMISRSTTSKFAFMDGNDVVTVGDFVEVNGIYYSNHGYKDYPYIGNTYHGGRGGYHFQDDDWYDERYANHYKYLSETASVTTGAKAVEDDSIPVISATLCNGDFNEDDIEHMRNEAIKSGSDDPAVVAFTARDGDKGLNYVDAEYILDFLFEDMDLNIYTCEFDDRKSVLYVTLDWSAIIILPTIVCNAEWSVVC